MINLHNIDCMEYMKTCKDNQFSLAIVDPPYGIEADNKNNGKNSDRHEITSKAKINTYKKTNWDSNVPDIDYFKQLIRISKHQIIWGINYYPYDLFTGGRIYWNKKVTMPTYSNGELAYCSKINSIKSFEFAWHGMIQEDMKNKETRQHPTQKPVALYKWLLHNYAKEGDTIFDSHSGSLSIGIACHDMKYDLTACELDKDYFEAGKLRLETHQRQNQINYDVIEETIEKDKTLFD